MTLNSIVRKESQIDDVEETSKDNRQLRFTISTETVDADYDVISVDGWDFTRFKKNPVVLFSHDADTLPIGKVVGLSIVGGSLKATVEFVPADVPIVGPQAEAIYQLLKTGFLSATSVGFQPLEFEISDRQSPTGKPGLNITRQSLYELSIVTIPSNPDALIEQRKLKLNSNDIVEKKVTEPVEEDNEIEIHDELQPDVPKDTEFNNDEKRKQVLRERRKRQLEASIIDLR